MKSFRKVSGFALIVAGVVTGMFTDVLSGVARTDSREFGRLAASSEYDLIFGNPRRWDESVVSYFVQREIQRDADVMQCMSASGFTYEIRSETAIRNEISQLRSAPSLTMAKHRGYGILAAAQDAGVPAEARTTSKQYRDALLGAGGCADKSRIRDDQIENAVGDFRNAYLESASGVMEEAIVRSAVADWSSCARRAGYPFRSPDEMRSMLAEGASFASGPGVVEGALQHEISVAVALIDCDKAYDSVVQHELSVHQDSFDRKFREEIIGHIARLNIG